MSKFLGMVNLNDIVSGKLECHKGDTFVAESEDSCGRHAFRYSPGFRTGQGEWNNFELLSERITLKECVEAAQIGAGVSDPIDLDEFVYQWHKKLRLKVEGF
jgi:hypothetical protein